MRLMDFMLIVNFHSISWP